jgi:hypothetical protein
VIPPIDHTELRKACRAVCGGDSRRGAVMKWLVGYMAVLDRDDKDEGVFLTYKEIDAKFNAGNDPDTVINIRTMERLLAGLAADGWLVKERKRSPWHRMLPVLLLAPSDKFKAGLVEWTKGKIGFASGGTSAGPCGDVSGTLPGPCGDVGSTLAHP